MSRVCIGCGLIGGDSDFHLKQSRCKACCAARDKGRVRCDPRDPKRSQYESARAAKRRWAQKNYDPIKNKARRAVRNAIESGAIQVQDKCSKCGEGKKRQDGARGIQAHHHNGYHAQLDVVWLCAACHRAEHYAARKP